MRGAASHCLPAAPGIGDLTERNEAEDQADCAGALPAPGVVDALLWPE